MSKTKQIKGKLYTERKLPTLANITSGRPEHPEKYLYSKGKYLTKIKKEDLPEHFIRGTYYRTEGYASAEGIKQMIYKPNMHINHMFKDDCLYVSYDKEIREEDTEYGKIHVGYDLKIWGWQIVEFLKAAEKYSNYDITEIKQQIEVKRQTFKEKYPSFYELEVGDRENFFVE